MGIQNREYMQSSRSFRFGGGRSMVATLIIINVAVFVAQILLTRASTAEEFAAGFDRVSIVTEWFKLDPRQVLQGQIWRLLTYDFLHSTDGIWHLFWNMYLLYMAGSRIESVYGSREFLWFYLFSGLFSGVFFLVWGLLTGTAHPVIGASGAVMAILVAYAMHWPMDRWYIFFFPVPVWMIVILDIAMDVFPLLQQLGGRAFSDNIAHAAHVGGVLFGFLYVRQQWRVSTWVSGVPQLRNPFKRRPKLRVHIPDREEPPSEKSRRADVEGRVDQLLEKISVDGEKSLTEEERQFLAEASRRYRNRRE